MTAFLLCVHLRLGANSTLALSLPQSRCFNPFSPQSTELQRCEPRLSSPLAGCPHPSRCSAKAQHRATFPKGKALRRRSKAKPLRGSRGGSAADHRFAKVRAAVKPAVSGLPSSVTVRRSAAPRHLPQGDGKALRRRGSHRFDSVRSSTLHTIPHS